MTFEEYLIGKKIDGERFQQREPELFENWKSEFFQMHPNSFSAQKLYLINPVRRRFPLKNMPAAIIEKKVQDVVANTENKTSPDSSLNSAQTKTDTQTPKPPRPVFKPKPKIS